MMSANMRNQNTDSWNRYETLSNSMRESEFPSLSEASTEKQRKTCNKRKLIVPLKTYKDELREKYRESRPATENVKTRMCNSIDKNEACFHGELCRFAHSLEELVIRDCHFKDKCRFVRIKSGKLANDGENICRNKHPQESQDGFIRRTGLSRYKTTHEEIDVEEVELEDKEPKADFACDRQTNYKCATEIKSSIYPTVINPVAPTFKFGSSPFIFPPAYCSPFMKFEGSRALNLSTNNSPVPKFDSTTPPPSLEKEIVLRVPKVFAMQAFELAMNSGNRCIRVEVIE